jgi:hypothetical protein
MVFDNYFYYDKEYDKLVGVVFVYSEVSNPKDKYTAAAYTAIKALSGTLGYSDPTTSNTTLASMFEHRDMIDFFKKHFHLKKQQVVVENPPKCVATYVGTPEQPAIDLCGDTLCISIECLINIQEQGGGRKSQKKEQEDGGKDNTIIVPIIDPIDPLTPDPPKPGPPIDDPQPPVEPQGNDKEQIYYSQSKYAVIGQLNQASVEKPFAENDDYVYFMQSTYGDNAVLAVNKITGNLTEVVPGKRKGSRPGIISIGAYGKDLYLDVEGLGIVRYNGKDVSTSEVMSKIDRGFMDNFKKIVFSPNGRYMAYGGQNCHQYVFDLKEGNRIVKSFHDGLDDFLVTDDGDFFGVNNFRALVYRNDGNPDSDPASVREMSDLLNDHPITIRQIGSDIYIVGGKRVMKTDSKEFVWTETSTITSEGLRLYDGTLDANGSGFAYMSDNVLNRFVIFSTSNKAPTMMKQLATNINVGRRDLLVVQNASQIFADSLGNIWMVEQSGAGFVVVYNPKGLAEMKNAAGKFIKQKE